VPISRRWGAQCIRPARRRSGTARAIKGAAFCWRNRHALQVSIDRGTILALGEVLPIAQEMTREGDYLYVADEVEAWTEGSRCAVVALDPYEEEPDQVEIDGVVLRLSLAAFQVQEVMENLRLSIGDPSRPECVAALQYYFEFDAFIDPSAFPRRS
jgi:hypothetical protein